MKNLDSKVFLHAIDAANDYRMVDSKNPCGFMKATGLCREEYELLGSERNIDGHLCAHKAHLRVGLSTGFRLVRAPKQDSLLVTMR